MSELIENIKEQFGSNQFLQGGFILGMISAIVIWGKDIVGNIWRFVYSLFFITVTADSTELFYHCVQKWINHEGITKNKRHAQVYIDDKTEPPSVWFLADRVKYLTRRPGFWATIFRYVDDQGGTGGGTGKNQPQTNTWLKPEKVSIQTFVWNRSRLHKFISNIAEEYTRPTGGVEVFSFSPWSGWHADHKITGVDFDRIILNNNLSEKISKDLDWFFGSRKWFDERQLPYQRGYIFKGPPGTGKTSLISALAKKYSLKLCMLEIADRNDADIKMMFSRAPKNSILCLEDFDSFFHGRKNICADSKITFSGLLNAINGISHGVGRLCIITTNETEKIDPALARAGRLDKHWHIGYLNYEQTKRLLHIYYPELDINDIRIHKFADAIEDKKISPADLVGHIQAHSMKPDLDVILDPKQFIIDCTERRKIMIEIKEEGEVELKRKEREEDGEDEDDDVCPKTGATIAKNVVKELLKSIE